VRVTAPGKKTYDSRVELSSGATRSLEVALDNDSKGLSPWYWIGGGVLAVAGASVGGYFLLRKETHPEGDLATVYLKLGTP
jgi:hypothetical protein